MSEALLTSNPKKKKKLEETCMLCSEDCLEQCALKDKGWESLQKKSELWVGLDTFGKVAETVNWNASPGSYFMHTQCKIKLYNSRALDQAKKRKEKLENANDGVEESNEKNQVQLKDDNLTRSTRKSFDGITHSKDLCIWCMKPEDNRHKNRKCSKLHLIDQWKSWSRFKSHTITLEDNNLRERLLVFISSCSDPFATEIRYHPECWRKYISHIKISDDLLPFQDVHIEEVKQLFLNHVTNVIFEENEPRTLKGLMDDYNDMLKNHNFQTINRTTTIKEMLENEFGDKIGFHNRIHKNKSAIVYDMSKGGSFIESAINFWGLSTDSMIKHVANHLRERCKGVSSMKWPPSTTDLEKDSEIPEEIIKFLIWLRNPSTSNIVNNDPKVISLGDMIFSYIANKRTKFQAQLSLLVHGETRSKELVYLLNKFGIGLSYTDILDLEAAWAISELIENPVCPVELAEGKPGVAVTDNDDFREDTLTGGQTSHRTNLMYVQAEGLEEHVNFEVNIPNIGIKKEVVRNITKSHNYSSRIRGNTAAEPTLNFDQDSNTSPQRDRMFFHSFCRNAVSTPFPSYSGFWASISEPQTKHKAYFDVTLPNPPKKSTVYDIMERCRKTAEFKSMPFIQLVGDQPVYALIIEIKNENHVSFEKIVPVLGGFHTACAFLSVIYRRFKGSGLEDLAVESGMVEIGSVDAAIKGKHYKRGMRIHKLVYESLICILIEQNESNEFSKALKEKLQRPFDFKKEFDENGEKMATDIKEMMNSYFSNISLESAMASFWLSYLEMVEILYLHYHSMRDQIWDEYLLSIRLMMPWMSAYDSMHYGRYLPVYWSMMKQLPEERASFMKAGMFTASITGKPFSSLPFDQWIEMTMNKGSKMKGGWIGITQNEEALQTNIKIVNKIAKVKVKLQELAQLKKRQYKHIECSPSRMKKDNDSVQNAIASLQKWNSVPWETEIMTLRSLESGLLASKKLEEDFLTARKAGEEKLGELFKERILSNDKKIYDRIPMNKRSNFSKPPKEEKLEKARKTDSMENRAMVKLISLAEGNALNLEQLMQYRLTEVCLPIFNINGDIRKAAKSKLVECFKIQDCHVEPQVAIVDMGFIWRKCIPTAADRDQVSNEYTWGYYAHKVFAMILERHPEATEYHLINDRYDIDMSIKDAEHKKRSALFIGGAKNVFPSANEIIPSANKFNSFFVNSENKTRLQAFLLQEFKVLADRHRKKIYYTYKEKCYLCSPFSTVQTLYCHQEEADTRVFYHAYVLDQRKDIDSIIIDAEDTDVVVISSFASTILQKELLLYRRKHKIRCKDLCPREVTDVIIGFHALTGADAVSGFYRQSKKKVFKKLCANSESRPLLYNIGRKEHLNERDISNAIKFVIKYMFNDKNSENLGQARATKWRSMKNKTTLGLPPDEDSFRLHLLRANYQAKVWYDFKYPSGPADPQQHGYTFNGQYLLPVCHTNIACPDILQTIEAKESDSEESDLDIESDANSDVDSDEDV